MPKTQVQNSRSIFSTIMRELRENMGVTQADLASRLKMTQSFVSKYESGERTLDFIEVYEICKALNTNIETFSVIFADRMGSKA